MRQHVGKMLAALSAPVRLARQPVAKALATSMVPMRIVAAPIGKALAGQGIPTWMTVLVMMLGAVGTYYLSPRLNQTFEAQKLRTEFVIKSLNDINDQTRALLGAMTTVSQSIVHHNPVSPAEFNEIAAGSTRLSWNVAFVFQVVEEDEESVRLCTEFATRLNTLTLRYADLRNALPSTDADMSKTMSEIGQDMGKLMEVTMLLGTKVADAGGLTPRAAKTSLLGP
jgi:hypothetical protein